MSLLKRERPLIITHGGWKRRYQGEKCLQGEDSSDCKEWTAVIARSNGFLPLSRVSSTGPAEIRPLHCNTLSLRFIILEWGSSQRTRCTLLHLMRQVGEIKGTLHSLATKHQLEVLYLCKVYAVALTPHLFSALWRGGGSGEPGSGLC